MTLAGLLGLKPALETLRDLLDAKPFPKQVLPNVAMLTITRVVELVFESSPETLIQAVALLATPAAEQSTLQVSGSGLEALRMVFPFSTARNPPSQSPTTTTSVPLAALVHRRDRCADHAGRPRARHHAISA